MRASSRTVLIASLALSTLAGCTTSYPYGSPIEGASLNPNRAPRGSAAFCETYARQSAANRYDELRDTDSGSSYNAFQASRARRAGGAAYERCLAGQTG